MSNCYCVSLCVSLEMAGTLRTLQFYSLLFPQFYFWPESDRASTPHVTTWVSVYPSICMAAHAPVFSHQGLISNWTDKEVSSSLEIQGRIGVCEDKDYLTHTFEF